MYENAEQQVKERYDRDSLVSHSRGALMAAGEAPAQETREHSATERALIELDHANQDLDAAVNHLNERLNPILHSPRPPAAEKEGTRPTMDAQIPEAIMSQVDLMQTRIRVLRLLISRLAI